MKRVVGAGGFLRILPAKLFSLQSPIRKVSRDSSSHSIHAAKRSGHAVGHLHLRCAPAQVQVSLGVSLASLRMLRKEPSPLFSDRLLVLSDSKCWRLGMPVFVWAWLARFRSFRRVEFGFTETSHTAGIHLF